MTSQPTIATMKLVAGDPALDFVNTVDCRLGGWGPDLLEDYAALLTWAARVGLVDPPLAGRLRAAAEADPGPYAAALIQAKLLREAIYRLFLVEGGGHVLAQDDLDRLDLWAGRALAERRLCVAEDGRVAWRAGELPDADLITRRVALAAADLLLKRGRRPVRQCPAPRCGWLFLDTTRGGRRLWCSAGGCGTRVRVRRFRAAG